MKSIGVKTKNYKYSELESFVERITSNTDQYYAFAANPNAWPDENTPPAVFDSVNDTLFDTQSKLLFGKRIKPSDIKPMAKRYAWTSNTVFDHYDNYDIHMYDKKFYVITDENKVYKILSNNTGSPSTVKPTLTQNVAFKTSDNYIWKYMFSLNSTLVTDYGTPGYIPVVPDDAIRLSAKAGIDYIETFSSGENYLTYVTGTIQSVLTANCVQIDNFASQDNDFYNLSSMYITSGPGNGTLRRITRYVSNTTGNFVYLNDYIANVVPALSKYKISPTIRVNGDGHGALAVCDVSEAYGISNVTVIATGEGYTRASIDVIANTTYGVNANLIAYVPPPGGHGANPAYELGVDSLLIRTVFANNEANTIPTEVSYRRYGILKNPNRFDDNAPFSANTFSNVIKITTSPATYFENGEKLVGQESEAEGYVAFSNASTTFLIGDKSFANAENIRSVSSNVVTAIASISTYGDIRAGTSEILYLNNTVKVNRANNASETLKIIYKF
jgi:hypothetical protein